MEENVTKRPDFTQVCVWEGKIVGIHNAEQFEDNMLKRYGVRVQYLEEIKTQPDVCTDENNLYLDEEGLCFDEDGLFVDVEDRNDLIFAVHDDDVQEFSVKRLSSGIFWIEDVYWEINYNKGNYDQRISEYRTWDPENMRQKVLMGTGNIIPGYNYIFSHVLPDHKSLF